MKYTLHDFLFRVSRFGHNVVGLFARCLFSTETLLMFIVLVVAFGLGCLYANLSHKAVGRIACATWSVLHMFDLSSAIDAIRNAHGWRGVLFPLLLYLATWLMGGGILLGVIIGRGGQYLQRIRDGLCRYRCGLADHYVILGWEPNSITLLRDLTKNNPRRCCLNFWQDRPRIVILSSYSAVEVKRQIMNAYQIETFGDALCYKLPFLPVIYNGVYDDADEFEKLNIEKARHVFVTGELNEEGHDSRILMTAAVINDYVAEKRVEHLPVKLRISSPVLHHQLANRKLVCNSIDLDLFSFHVNWAKGLWDRKGRAKIADDRTLDLEQCVDNATEQYKSAALVVIGLGRMGLAIIERAMEIAPSLRRPVDIIVADPHGGNREQFETSYHEDIDRCGASCTFDYVTGHAESADFLAKLNALMDQDRPIVVAVTLSRPDKALESAFNVERMIRDHKCKKVRILLRQNVEVDDVEGCTLIPAKSYGLDNMYLFGFQNGAGYGAMQKEQAENEES